MPYPCARSHCKDTAQILCGLFDFIIIKHNVTCKLICWCWSFSYHSASKTYVRDWIFKVSPIRASVIYRFLWINSVKVLLHLGKNPLYCCLMFPKNYPEVGDANFKYALLTFKKHLALKMRARCRIFIVLLQTLCTVACGTQCLTVRL